MQGVNAVTIKGHTSIRDARVELRQLNALVGANGAGKSNFIRAIELFGRVFDGELQYAVERDGGASALLHQPSKANEMVLEIDWEQNSYRVELEATADNRLIIASEQIKFQGPDYSQPWNQILARGARESGLREEADRRGTYSVASNVADLISGCRVFHFHDTSRTAAVKGSHPTADNQKLQADARNLAAMLWGMQQANDSAFRRIVGAVQQVAPFFRDFVLEPERNDEIRLRWRQVDSDTVYSAFQMSDGTIRFVCLATLLLQSSLPGLIVLDEPELGLHPYAIAQLAGMLTAASVSSQVIVATQSVTLMDQFQIDNLIVTERESGSSVFKRPQPDHLVKWLEDYSLSHSEQPSADSW